MPCITDHLSTALDGEHRIVREPGVGGTMDLTAIDGVR